MAMCSAGERCPRSGGGLPVSPREKPLAGWRLPEGKRATLTRRPLPFLPVTGVVSGVFSGSTGYSVKEPSYTRAPSAPGCLAAAGRQARLRQAAAGA
ncbi:hypothetical protein JTG49_005129, partial [Escherichia coli]|nr:hypothetical protein [Escherichia coli]